MTAGRIPSQRATEYRLVRTAATGLLALVLTACGSAASDNPTLSAPTATSGGTSGATSSTAATPASCPLTPQHVPPPVGASTDLAAKPTVAPSSAAPPAQVQVADIVLGTGAEAKAGSSVKVKYVGAFYDTGKQFDSSWSRGADQTLPFGVCSQQVIPGFSVAPIGMKVGGRREVVIPSQYGYGAQGSGPIPGGATLVFVIDLVAAAGP